MVVLLDDGWLVCDCRCVLLRVAVCCCGDVWFAVGGGDGVGCVVCVVVCLVLWLFVGLLVVWLNVC